MTFTNTPAVWESPQKQANEDNLHSPQVDLLSKLWVYTNYNCNLRCSYCTASSTPLTPALAIELDIVKRIVDEAKSLGFREIFFTGGEPFILKDIGEILTYSSRHIKTTVLTNAMLLNHKRLAYLDDVNKHSLTFQVSLDGGFAHHHDPYRGEGTWVKTVEGIQRLQDMGFLVRLSTTETPANSQYLKEVCSYHLSIGIPEEDHIIRPLAKRGFSQQGIEVDKTNLVPEITINREGAFWHPLSTEADMLVSEQIFPLVKVIECFQEEMNTLTNGGNPKGKFT